MSRRTPHSNHNGKKQNNSREQNRKTKDEKSGNNYGSQQECGKGLDKNISGEDVSQYRNFEKYPSHGRSLASEEERPRGSRGRGRGKSGFISSARNGRWESGEGRGRSNPRGVATSNVRQEQQHQQAYSNKYKANKKSSNDHMSEQDVLISFMPFLRHDKDQGAVKIYEAFQTTGDHATFVQQARNLILEKRKLDAVPKPHQQQPNENVIAEESTVQEETSPVKAIGVDNDAVQHFTSDKEEDPESLQEENTKNTTNDSLSVQGATSPKQQAFLPPKEDIQEKEKAVAQCVKDHTSVTVKPVVVHSPKRIFRNQPGTICIGGASTNRQQQVFVRPRQEIEARWSIPLSHIRLLMANATDDKKQESIGFIEEPNNLHGTVVDANDTTNLQQLENGIRSLLHVCIGLFRLGTETNYNIVAKQNTSIISKEVESFQLIKARHDSPDGEENLLLTGKVPFYAPRTPGNVIFRMYMETNPVITLATSSHVVIHLLDPQQDLDPTLRFVLSGIKSRKGSGLGSLYTVASVLSSWVTVVNVSSVKKDCMYYEAAGRALWGCICECRKLVENSKTEYQSKIENLAERIATLSKHNQQQQVTATNIQEEEQEEGEEEDEISIVHADAMDVTGEEKGVDGSGINEVECESKLVIIKKLVSARKERARLERNWRDIQAAFFVSIIHTIVSNEEAMLALLRQDAISKLRIEYELWCPICEQSAPAPLKAVSASSFAESKHQMQRTILGFIPDERVLAYSRNKENLVGCHSKALPVLSALTTSMHDLYDTELCPTSDFYKAREHVRSEMERFVNKHCSACFPLGSRVMVFGSSANGFGSPTSDLDMCLQLPKPVKNDNFSADAWFVTKGREAMQALADTLMNHGMKEVDSSRLTARIPVIMFRYPLPATTPEEEQLLDCDISIRNPLALLNTQFLRIYSMLDPRIPVLSSVIKRWAKARRINDPKTHTLSSYGYLIMLLHFLLLRRKKGMCLPNLLYTDPNWKYDEEYNELDIRPVIDSLIFPHPHEDACVVNAYFYQPRGEAELRSLQRVVSGEHGAPGYNDSDISCSAGFLLAEFFRYYAYEFDYKHHVISLHSGGRSRGFVEKEMKGEFDGWKLGSESLGIEDPFERFYNVAHVVTGTKLRRIRKEFALAFTKISSRCLMGKGDDLQIDIKEDLLNLLCEFKTVEVE